MKKGIKGKVAIKGSDRFGKKRFFYVDYDEFETPVSNESVSIEFISLDDDPENLSVKKHINKNPYEIIFIKSGYISMEVSSEDNQIFIIKKPGTIDIRFPKNKDLAEAIKFDLNKIKGKWANKVSWRTNLDMTTLSTVISKKKINDLGVSNNRMNKTIIPCIRRTINKFYGVGEKE